MENLRDQFEYALSADPGADAGRLADVAIAEGGRVRRRRHRIAVAGVAAAIVAAGGVTAGVLHQPRPTEALRTLEADAPALDNRAMLLVGASSDCENAPPGADATDPALFLTAAATDGQKSALAAALRADPRVTGSFFMSRDQAYDRFRKLWSDSPDFVKSVTPQSLPEVFYLRLKDATQYETFKLDYAAQPGIQDIIGSVCPASAPIGGIE
ncbi:permease-like cell division protein FtsX [Symbioplanes lichenis]|uniref:permease-like cell division protein FtsX n=1 Tax=Symbioplanes lichenis TaxID=1629072 RepID=UPI002738602A|nr:permease-like cell division protein FtsX [Actinoplanes lichenis]